MGDTGKPKGFIGVHGALVSAPDTPEYIHMIGGKFLTHPKMGQTYRIRIKNTAHPIMDKIEEFEIVDELYLMETYPPYELLMLCDFAGFERPVAWAKPYGLGRVFYISLGHGQSQIENPYYKSIISNALNWCGQI